MDLKETHLKKTLDCSSYSSTVKSLTDIFQINETKLLSLLQAVNSDYPDDIYKSMRNSLSGKDYYQSLMVLWFHASRVENINSFKNRGILRTSKIKPELDSLLKNLSSGIPYKPRKNPLSQSIAGKGHTNDEGPHAFLYKEISINGSTFNNNYTEAPELVEQIAEVLVGGNRELLLKEFKSRTQRCIVTFSSEARGDEIGYALKYVKLYQSLTDKTEAAECALTTYDSHGKNVSAQEILSVEKI